MNWLEQQTSADEFDLKSGRTRFALKAAAAKLLEEYGFDQQSIGMVSESAGVTRTTFYRYFATLNDLMLELTRDYQAFLETSLVLEKRARRPDEVVREVNRKVVGIYAANVRLVLSFQEFRRTLPNDDPLQLDMNYALARRIVNAIAAESGGEGAIDARKAFAGAYALENMVDGFLAELYVRGNPHLKKLALSEDEVAEILSDVWIAGTRSLGRRKGA